MDNQTKDLLQRASNEIKQLRQQNASMAARLDMFDKCMDLFYAQQNRGNMGMGEDITWQIKMLIEASETK